MKRILVILLMCPLLLQAQEAENIKSLFDSLKTHPAIVGDEINVQLALTGKKMATGNLYPEIDLFGKYDHTSTPSGMLPVPPNKLIGMVQNQTVAQPFSENIFRAGITVSMPIFVASIFPMVSKAKQLVKSAEAQQHLNLLKNEAIIVGANANFQYIQSLDQALKQKRASLEKTREFVEIKVKNGRAPNSALLKIDDGINQIDITINELAQQREEVKAVIKSLTGVTLNSPVKIEQIGTFKEGELKALDPLRNKVEADHYAYRAEKEKLLPAVVAQGVYSSNYAKAYNIDQNINNDFTSIGIGLRIPLFSKEQYARIRKSKLEFQSTQNKLEEMKLELSAQAEQLQNSLQLINNSVTLIKKNVDDKTELLNIAKVSYASGQLSMEDYLKYEDDLVLEKSKLYKAQAQKWQTLMKLNVIFGNNIEEVIK